MNLDARFDHESYDGILLQDDSDFKIIYFVIFLS